jgi:hypothetical protein
MSQFLDEESEHFSKIKSAEKLSTAQKDLEERFHRRTLGLPGFGLILIASLLPSISATMEHLVH